MNFISHTAERKIIRPQVVRTNVAVSVCTGTTDLVQIHPGAPGTTDNMQIRPGPYELCPTSGVLPTGLVLRLEIALNCRRTSASRVCQVILQDAFASLEGADVDLDWLSKSNGGMPPRCHALRNGTPCSSMVVHAVARFEKEPIADRDRGEIRALVL